MSIATRIYVLIAGMLLLAAMVAGALMWRITVHNREFGQVLTVDVAAADQARQMQVNFKIQVQEWKNILLRGSDPAQLEKYSKAFAEQRDKVQQLGRELKPMITDPDALTQVDAFLTEHEQMGKFYQLVLNAFTDGHGADAKTADAAVKGKDRGASGLIDSLVDRLLKDIRDDHAHRLMQTENERNLILVILVVAGLAVMVLAILQARRLVGDIRRTETGLGQIAKHDLTHQIGLARKDEIGQMARSLDQTVLSWRATVTGVVRAATTVTDRSQSIDALSQRIASMAEETSSQATTSAAAVEEVSANISTVSSNAAQLSKAVEEIARNTSEAAGIASEAATRSAAASAAVGRLDAASREVGEVVKLIAQIAGKTNLLALNATIEAASAGDAGRGFAVVANEVKDLARQTAEATERIGQRVTSIQAEASASSSAIGEIDQVVRRISQLATSIAAAVEEQSALTKEIGRNVDEVAAGAKEIAGTVSTSASAAKEAAAGVVGLRDESRELAELAASLRSSVAGFKV